MPRDKDKDELKPNNFGIPKGLYSQIETRFKPESPKDLKSATPKQVTNAFVSTQVLYALVREQHAALNPGLGKTTSQRADTAIDALRKAFRDFKARTVTLGSEKHLVDAIDEIAKLWAKGPVK